MGIEDQWKLSTGNLPSVFPLGSQEGPSHHEEKWKERTGYILSLRARLSALEGAQKIMCPFPVEHTLEMSEVNNLSTVL